MNNRPLVVVVDDDPSVCKAMQRLLRIAQMEVETFPSADAFLLTVWTRAPDCLVLDVRMPGVTGPELRDRLYDTGWRPPIVFITAHDETVPAGRDPDGPGSEVLLKPFDDQSLLDAIRRAIAGRHGSGAS